jgi:hypothetical protein
MIRRSPNDLARVRAAQAKLEKISDATGGHGVEPLWLDEAERWRWDALPDALYVNRGDPHRQTQLYDTRKDTFHDIAWGDWLAAQHAGNPSASGNDGTPP